MMSPGPITLSMSAPDAITRVGIRSAQASIEWTGESGALARSSVTPGRDRTSRIASSSKRTGSDEPNMKTPAPPGPKARVTSEKTDRKVLTWVRNSARDWPYGIHSIITPPGRSLPAVAS